jgi:hypothetical protein
MAMRFPPDKRDLTLSWDTHYYRDWRPKPRKQAAKVKRNAAPAAEHVALIRPPAR